MKNLAALRFILIATLLFAVVMAVELSPYKPTSAACDSRCAAGFDPPIASLELAHSFSDVRERIDRGDTKANRAANIHIVKINTWFDYIFIPLYVSLFVLFALHGSKWFARLTIIAIVLALIFDYIEDFLLYSSLNFLEANGAHAIAPGYVSHIKWSLIAAACLLQPFHGSRRCEGFNTYIRE
jgi:hypothetical protein